MNPRGPIFKQVEPTGSLSIDSKSRERIGLSLNQALQGNDTVEPSLDASRSAQFPLWVDALSRVHLGDMSPSEFSGRLAKVLQQADGKLSADGACSASPEALLKTLCSAVRFIDRADLLVFWERILSSGDSQPRAASEDRQEGVVSQSTVLAVLKAFSLANTQGRSVSRTPTECQGAIEALDALLQQVSSLSGGELLGSAAIVVFSRTRDAHAIECLRSIIDSLSTLSEENVRKVSESLLSFCLIRQIDGEKARGWVQNIIPEIINESALALSRYGFYENRMGFVRNPREVHSADFIIDCFTKTVTPRNMNELMLRGRTLPTLSTGVYLTNRDDGIAISSIDNTLRNHIHRESPVAHAALHLCLEYVDGLIDAHTFEARLMELDPEFRGTKLLDVSLYSECPTSAPVPEPLLDILRRLFKNTAQTTSALPQPTQPGLVEAVQALNDAPFSGQAVTEFLKEINGSLIGEQGALGISPNLVHTALWGASRVSQHLLNLSFENVMGLPKSPLFRELLLFQELTAHAGTFDPLSVRQTIDQICSHWGEDSLRAAGRRVVERSAGLVESYRESEEAFLIPGMLSGTIDDAILGLTIRAKPTSRIGQRYAEEQSSPLWLRVWGD